MVRCGVEVVQMKKIGRAGCLIACVLFASTPECLSMSLLAPTTNEIVSLNIQTGEVDWKAKLPFKADSLLEICGELVRVTSAGNAEPKRIAFLDRHTGQLQQGTNQDCAMLSGRRYTATGQEGKFFKENWRIKERNLIDGRLEFVDGNGTVRWVIERKGIRDSVAASDDFLIVASHEWKPARRPILSAYVQGAHTPSWVFDLNRAKTPKGRHSDYLSAAITERSVFLYWVGMVFQLDRRTGGELRRTDCGSIGLSGELMNETGILVAVSESLIVFHRQNILCLDENLARLVWSYRPDLVGNLLPSPVVEGNRLYFFRGLNQ
jgi:outer membrane protein assembly factor BamB